MPPQPKSSAKAPDGPKPAYHTMEQFRCLYDPDTRSVSCEPFLRTFLQAGPPHGPFVELLEGQAQIGGGKSGLPRHVPIGEKWVHPH